MEGKLLERKKNNISQSLATSQIEKRDENGICTYEGWSRAIGMSCSNDNAGGIGLVKL
jgi:hypothetical protein